jgi:flagellar biosynthesis protein FlhF
MNARGAVEKRPTMNGTKSDDTRTFRGRTLEEVLPQIKAELGGDAEIVRQREGLMGGVGGFFQRPCIEVEARPGDPLPPTRPARRFDAYDDDPAMPEPLPPYEEPEAEAPPQFEPDPMPAADDPTAEGLSAPGIQEILRQAAPFADHLNAAAREFEPQPSPGREPLPALRTTAASPGSRTQIGDAIAQTLVEAGIDAGRASEIVAETVSHVLPFGSPSRGRKLVREALARRVPVAAPPAFGGRSLAFVGPGGAGKTLCTARLAVAYARGSDLPVVCVALRPADGGTELRSVLEPLGVGVTPVASAEQARAHVAGALGHALVVVDTPAVSPGSIAEVGRLASELETLGVSEVHLTLPATYSAAAAAELAERLSPLRPTHLALTHMDETTRVGGLVDFVIYAGRPLSYVSEGTDVPGGLMPADAIEIAARVLP